MPRQMPSRGRPVAANVCTASARPRARRPAIASPKAPTPGRIRRRRGGHRSGSADSRGVAADLRHRLADAEQVAAAVVDDDDLAARRAHAALRTGHAGFGQRGLDRPDRARAVVEDRGDGDRVGARLRDRLLACSAALPAPPHAITGTLTTR